MPVMHVFYVKNVRTGLYHASASYGGRWGKVAQLWTRRRDAENRREQLLYDQNDSWRQGPESPNRKGDKIVILETDVVLE